MHHGMGVSAEDPRCVENTVMQQPRNGLCYKIQNYASDLGQWYVNVATLARGADFRGQHPRTGFVPATGEGGRISMIKVAGVRQDFSRDRQCAWKFFRF